MPSFWDRLKFKKKPFQPAKPDAQVRVAKATPNEAMSNATGPITAMAAATSLDVNRILLHPYLSEKATVLGERSVAVFEVSVHVSAQEVSRAVEALYGIRPVAVNMVTLRGRTVRFGGTFGRTKTRKKAMVTLPEGKKIDLLK